MTSDESKELTTEERVADDSDMRYAKGGFRLSAYYYGFDATGVVEIDRILAAVACAGDGYHHTENWNERDRPDAESYIEKIQRWANAAAAQLRTAQEDATIATAARRLVRARDLFRTADVDDWDYTQKSDELTRAEHAFYDAATAFLSSEDTSNG